MLDAFTIEFAQEFLDLALAALALFIERDADLAVRRGQRLGRQAGILAFNVEEADFAKIEQALVIVGPVLHPAGVDVVRQVIDQLEACAFRVFFNAGQIFEIDVIDRQTLSILVFVTINQI